MCPPAWAVLYNTMLSNARHLHGPRLTLLARGTRTSMIAQPAGEIALLLDNHTFNACVGVHESNRREVGPTRQNSALRVTK